MNRHVLFLRSGTPMVLCDDERRISDANGAASLALRRTREQLVGLRLEALMPVQMRAAAARALAAALSEDPAAPPPRRLWLALEAADGEGVSVVATCHPRYAGDTHLVALRPIDGAPAREQRGGGRLTERERQVVARIATGQTGAAIADELFLSPATVERHVASALRKLGARNRAHCVALALRSGELDGARAPAGDAEAAAEAAEPAADDAEPTGEPGEPTGDDAEPAENDAEPGGPEADGPDAGSRETDGRKPASDADADDPAPIRALRSAAAERLRAEQALVGAEARLREAAAAVPAACLTLSVDGRIAHVDAAAERLLGWPASDLTGRLLHDLLRSPPSERPSGDDDTRADGLRGDGDARADGGTSGGGTQARWRRELVATRTGEALAVEYTVRDLPAGERSLGHLVMFRPQNARF